MVCGNDVRLVLNVGHDWASWAWGEMPGIGGGRTTCAELGDLCKLAAQRVPRWNELDPIQWDTKRTGLAARMDEDGVVSTLVWDCARLLAWRP